MKIIYSLLLFSFGFLLPGLTQAQTAPLLDSLPTTKDEFIASEKKFINTANWLIKTPLDQQENKRAKQSAFLIAWISNAPTVTVMINSKFTPLNKKNPQLLVIYMAAYAKYVLQNNYSKDEVKCTVAAIESVILVYQRELGKTIKKDKDIEKFIKLQEKGELEEWVSTQLEKK